MQAFTQTATQPSTGDGSESNPFEIATLENLYWLTQSDTVWDKHFIQIANIDASTSIAWDNDSGFIPIGNPTIPFIGSYNGKGHTIDGIYINRPDDNHIGLFGKLDIDANIDSLGITNINVKGRRYVGGMAGLLMAGRITNCFTSGTCDNTISDTWWVALGGLVGYNYGEISFCYSDVDVSSTYDMVGGFVGTNEGIITQSYSMGDVIGDSRVGGFAGNNSDSIQYCYSRSSVIANTSTVGGFVGYNNSGSNVSCFWDTETSSQSNSDGGVGITTAEMQDIKTYLYAEWDFMDETYNGTNFTWGINNIENDGYPFLQWQGYTNNAVIECQAPISPVSSIVFGDILANSIKVESFTKSGYGTSGYLIYFNTEDTWTIPIDGSEPIADTSWQNNGQQCIYFGTSNNPNVTVTGLSVSTKYYFKIYSYSDCSGIKKYEQTGASINRITDISAILPIGDGTEINPYEINTLENLFWLTQSDTIWDKHFIQTADIDASTSIAWDNGQGFKPIGNTEIKFTGIYNGKNHTIDSIYINRPGGKNIGLIGFMNSNAHIDSLRLTNINILGELYIGGLAGQVDLGKITNCYTSGICIYDASYYWIAGIGGLVGFNNRGSIENCLSDVEVSCIVSAWGDGVYVGGLVGWNNGSIIRSYCIGNVTGGNDVGGMIGKNSGTISQSYSLANVTGNCCVGGMIGGNSGTISQCYSQGKTTGNGAVGGLVGSNSGSVTFCFWDTETSEQTSSEGGGIGITTVEMQDIKKYLKAEWDFMDESYNGTNDIWGLNSEENDGYPFLQWQGFTNVEILECQAPLLAADDIILGDIFANDFNLESFTKAGYGTAGYAIYINNADTWVVPAEGEEPIADTSWQNIGQQCIYFDTLNSPNISITGLSENTMYYLKVYAFNDCNGVELYEQTGTGISQISDMLVTTPDGNGSSSNPYIIANRENLAWLMRNDTAWNKYYIQTADIDASASINWDEGKGFNPIGNSTTAFEGSYNGKGYIIDNIYINRPTDSLIGLFGNAYSAQIDSLGLTNVDIEGSKNMGGLAGYFSGGQITNCYTTGTCKSNNSNDWRAIIGGLAGYNSGKISFCYSEVDVSSGYGIVGGLVGRNIGTVTQSHSQGNVAGYSLTGGLVGYNSALISFCFSDVSVSSNSDYVGGLVGVNDDIISCSYSSGNVIGNNYLGGLAGINEGRVSFCYSDVNVSSYNDAIGGLVGLNADFISCSYSVGNVTGNNYVGGFVGVNLDFIIQCYSKSNVNANNFGGGLIGDNYGYVISSFWDKEISTMNTSGGGEGLTTSDMQNIKPYYNASWDFMDETVNGSKDYWGLNSSKNEGYPFLYWQGYTNTAAIPTDINGIENTDISIYPNPVSEVLNITTTDEGINRLVITDINGKKIIERNVVNRTEQIDMSSLNSGIYLINIYKGNEVYTSKIIKR